MGNSSPCGALRMPVGSLACLLLRDQEEWHVALYRAAHIPGGFHIPIDRDGAELCRGVVEHNVQEGVTWISSFVSEDKTRTFCVYDAPSPEAIRKTGIRNELPVDEITQVRVLDPYLYA
jgi:hypothetical protein